MSCPAAAGRASAAGTTPAPAESASLPPADDPCGAVTTQPLLNLAWKLCPQPAPSAAVVARFRWTSERFHRSPAEGPIVLWWPPTPGPHGRTPPQPGSLSGPFTGYGRAQATEKARGWVVPNSGPGPTPWPLVRHLRPSARQVRNG